MTKADKNGWRSDMENAPKNDEFLAALQVRNMRSGITRWERHILAFDDETGEIDIDYDQGWSWIDYTRWQPLPEPPEVSE